MQAIWFIQKILIFIVINCGVLAGVLWIASGANRDIHLNNWETESNLLVMGGQTHEVHYNVALLGTSRGRVFSRDNNHQMVEKILGRKVINLSKGGGGGLMPAELHLSYFYYRGNSVDHVVYLVDPWVFFSPINNEENDFFLRDEPFEFFILKKLVTDGYPSNRISSYLQMITVRDWQAISRYAAPGLTSGLLKTIDHKKLLQARQHYLSKYVENGFEKYSRFVDVINTKVKAHNGRITYVMLPMLIPDFPGMDRVHQKLLQAAELNDHVTYYNCSGNMHDRQYFYDHMHFNKTGIAYFTNKVIKPVLQGEAPQF